MRFRSLLLALLIVPLGMACCAAAPSMASSPPTTDAAAKPDIDPRFAAGLDRLLEDSPESGDWLILGVSITDSLATSRNRREAEQVWFVRLSAEYDAGNGDDANSEEFTLPARVGPVRRGTTFTAPASAIHVESFDHNGELLDKTDRTVPSGAVGASLEDLGRFLAGDEPEDENDEAVTAAMNLVVGLRTVTRSGPFRPIRHAARRAIIREPNLITFIFNAFRIDFRADFSDGSALEESYLPGLGALPQYRARSPLHVAGQHVCNAEIVVGPAEGPYHLTAGLLSLTASHPLRPASVMTVRVLATSDGSPE